ncbi:MAG: RtcB family protein [Bacteroidota bacterium]
MAKGKLKKRDLVRIGIKNGRAIGVIVNVLYTTFKDATKEQKLDLLTAIKANPQQYLEHEQLAKVAEEIMRVEGIKLENGIHELTGKAAFEVFGKSYIDESTLDQMYTAIKLPVAVGGALMPDAHVGYGLPIGGVLATEQTVIPYGVGVDIGCRMCLSVFDIPTDDLTTHHDTFQKELVKNTRFGQFEVFEKPLEDPIFEREEFRQIGVARRLKQRAVNQIGSSGGGNHFVEFSTVKIVDPENEWGLAVGTYVGLLSHSGSRGLGAAIANYYTKMAKKQCKLPKGAQHLAWLELNSELGHDYWRAMNLAGDYASACHDHIHRRVAKALNERPLFRVENHHNFAWKEKWNGKDVIVHRKGATPAGKGVLGIIPGSMTDPGFIVRGRGVESSLNSASHGAGRRMSRRVAKANLNKSEVDKHLAKHGVSVVGAGLDEAPMAYKDIREVMRHQTDLVDIVGEFVPKIVRMAHD